MINQTVDILIGVIILWLTGVTFYLYKSIVHYHRLADGKKGETLTEILDKILNSIDKTKVDVGDLKRQLSYLKDKSVNYVQKVGILRFNPFGDTGGDQSFVLAILDETDTGVLLTSLHGRGVTRWYAKNVKGGKGVDYELSKEETEAIKHAVYLKQKKR